MKSLHWVCVFAAFALTGCDSDSGGGASDASSTAANSTGSDAPSTAGTSGPGMTSTPTTAGETTTSTSAVTDTDTPTDTATETDTPTGDSGSSTGGPGVIPCQSAEAKASIESWAHHADSHMPTLGELAGASNEVQSQASLGGIAGVPMPQGGGGGFIETPDGGGTEVECDIWAQDCPEGEKCAAWASDGGGSWNATRCVPVDDNPVGPGESCTATGGGTSGFDNCDETSMCWDIDPETNTGTCVSLCQGSPETPTCAEELTTCSVTNDGVIILCLPVCNPLANECPEGQGCYAVNNVFQCAPTAGGAAPGEPCEFLNACTDGAGCVNAPVVPGCPAGSAGCCSNYCNPQGDGSECLEGQECVPFYEMGDAPEACVEDVGLCVGG